MKINIKNNKSISASLDEIDLLTNNIFTLTQKLENALCKLPECKKIDAQKAQLYSNNIDSVVSPTYLTFNIDDSIFNKAKDALSTLYPKTKITNPFVVRIALNYYIENLKFNISTVKPNKNQNVNWADQNNISYDSVIYEHGKPIIEIRGIYGILLLENNSEKCLYVGRSNSIYSRLFSGDCHIAAMRNGSHINSVNNAILNGCKIHIKVLEIVPLLNDHPAKDAQRLASRENYYIDFYQEKNQCLEQYPEGRWC